MTSDNQYKIAILLPTRGRTVALTRSVLSLVNRAVDVSSIELLFGFDDDDTVGMEHFEKELKPHLDRRDVAYQAFIFSPLGYSRLNEYVNTLAMSADADWLIFWNDDAVMDSTGWDRVITSHTGEFKLLAFHTHRDHPYSIFPIVPRAWLDLIGYLSPHQISDCWLSQQAYLLDIWERIPVWVTHDRADLTGNNKDATFQNRIMFEGNPADPRDFNYIEWTRLRLNDCEKLAQYMESQGISTQWWRDVLAKKQDPWVKMNQNDPNNQVHNYKVQYSQ
jgi:hypothetical protein